MTDLHALPGHLIRRCHQISVGLFLEKCAAFDLTPLQYSALRALEEIGPSDQIRIAEVTAMDRTTVANVLANLERRGLVRRQVSKTDRRAKTVFLQPAGQTLLENAQAAVNAAQAKFLEPLSADEADQLLSLLTRIADENNAASRSPVRNAPRPD